MLQGFSVPEAIQTFTMWALALSPLIIIGFFLLKRGLKGAMPGLTNFFYFMIPTYIISIILVFSIGADELNQFSPLTLSTWAYCFCPPLVWDALFGMSIDNRSYLLAWTATFFIVFLPVWLATRSSAGRKEVEEDGKKAFLKRLSLAWILVTVMGLGMTNFYSFLFTSTINITFLGLNILIWIIIIVAIVIVVVTLRKKRAKKVMSSEGCQMIDGELICPEV